MHGLMNDTKWREIRVAMYGLSRSSGRPIRWRTKDGENGHVSDWDGEWFHHFLAGGFGAIEWLEIELRREDGDEILGTLRKIHVPAEVGAGSVRIFGRKEGRSDWL